MDMIPFRVDPSWYDRYWWSDPAPDRTACRACKANRGRLLRAADAMKMAVNPLKIVLVGSRRILQLLLERCPRTAPTERSSSKMR